jgi:hypothetical protein
MSEQLICDNCGTPIDQAQPYFQLSGSAVQSTEGVLTAVSEAITLHYHDEHLPVGVQPAPPADTSPGEPQHPARPKPDNGHGHPEEPPAAKPPAKKPPTSEPPAAVHLPAEQEPVVDHRSEAGQ